MNALQKLRSIVDELKAPTEPMKILDHWQLAGRLLSRMPVEDQRGVDRAVRERDLEALDVLVSRLERPEEAQQEVSSPASESLTFSKEELDHAMKAFRKRLKVMRLEDESKLGGRYVSAGRASKIDAIMPPGEFPREIWTALEQAGKLEHTGQGFFREPGAPKRF